MRNPESGLATATRGNPAVALGYGNFNPDGRGIMVSGGRAQLDSSDAARRQVHGGSPEGGRSRDPERKGAPLIIDRDGVDGFITVV